MYKQYLPTYTHNFLNEKKWIKKESLHYKFYFFPKSFAEKEIEKIIKTQEFGYKKIINFLKIKAKDRKIEYYLYPDKKTKKILTGDDWYAQAVFKEFCVHLIYNEKIKPLGPHEDMHLLSLPLGLPVGFIQEGLAEYIVGHAWDKKSHLEYAIKGYKKNIYPNIEEFLIHKSWLKTDDKKAIFFYSLAGAFVKFLIAKNGKKKFLEFYKKSSRKNTLKTNKSIFYAVFGKEIAKTEQQFKIWLNK